jgi:hypothetical protein
LGFSRGPAHGRQPCIAGANLQVVASGGGKPENLGGCAAGKFDATLFPLFA